MWWSYWVHHNIIMFPVRIAHKVYFWTNMSILCRLLLNLLNRFKHCILNWPLLLDIEIQGAVTIYDWALIHLRLFIQIWFEVINYNIWWYCTQRALNQVRHPTTYYTFSYCLVFLIKYFLYAITESYAFLMKQLLCAIWWIPQSERPQRFIINSAVIFLFLYSMLERVIALIKIKFVLYFGLNLFIFELL
jgi:hypothetical protein